MSTRRAFFAQIGVATVAAATGMGRANTALADVPSLEAGGMKTYKIARTELAVSRIAYGCGSLGGERSQLNTDVLSNATRLINAAYESGITFFDLADVYEAGRSESVFGNVLKQSPSLRSKIVVQSKCGFAFNGREPIQYTSVAIDLSREHIVRAAEGSLNRLGIDHLDILLLHWPDALTEPEEVAAGFEDLHRGGKVRYFGVSNHTPGQIELLQKSVRQPLVTNQIPISLAYSSPIGEGMDVNRNEHAQVGGALDYCRLHDIRVQAYSPVRGDLLNPPPDAASEVKEAAAVLADIAAKKGVTPAAVALAWLLRHPAGIIPVIGATQPEHVTEDCAADRVNLSREEWYALFIAGAKIQSRVIV